MLFSVPLKCNFAETASADARPAVPDKLLDGRGGEQGPAEPAGEGAEGPRVAQQRLRHQADPGPGACHHTKARHEVFVGSAWNN